MNFTPLKDFTDEELRSAYCVGLNYTVKPRAPNPSDPDDHGTPAEKTLLYAKVQQWLKDGKVRLGTADMSPAAEAKVRGAGAVK